MTITTEKKRVNISQKHQITIPKCYFNLFKFDKEAEFSVINGNLVLKPIKNISQEDEFLSNLNDNCSGHPIIGLAEGKIPPLEDINILDEEVTEEFEDYL